MLPPRHLLLCLAVFPCLAQEAAPDLTFHAQTRLVLLSFHATRGANYRNDLQPSDVVLLEDGVPRAFTIFDSPTTQGRMPLELVLLFDTNRAAQNLWDPRGFYRFIPHCKDDLWAPILNRQDADVRISIYHTRQQNLIRLCPSTTDPHLLSQAVSKLLLPELIRPGSADGVTLLSLPPRRERVKSGAFTNDYKTSPFFSQQDRGWPMEAAIAMLNQIAASPDRVSRVLVMFSEGIGATTTEPPDVGDQALDLGIPIYPIATNYHGQVTSNFPRNLFRMHQFAALAKLTGGLTAEYSEMDAPALQKLLLDIRHDGLTEYVVGFAPASSDSAREHKLEVRFAGRGQGQVEGGMRRATY